MYTFGKDFLETMDNIYYTFGGEICHTSLSSAPPRDTQVFLESMSRDLNQFYLMVQGKSENICNVRFNFFSNNEEIFCHQITDTERKIIPAVLNVFLRLPSPEKSPRKV